MLTFCVHFCGSPIIAAMKIAPPEIDLCDFVHIGPLPLLLHLAAAMQRFCHVANRKLALGRVSAELSFSLLPRFAVRVAEGPRHS